MAMRVLYVENDTRACDKLAKAVEVRNRQANREAVLLTVCASPWEMPPDMPEMLDVVIADVLFDDPSTGIPDSKAGLDQILANVRKWETDSLRLTAIPVIAYTDRDKGSLKVCLKHEDDLFDILDKNAASEEYLAWRLYKLELEMSRLRPGRHALRLLHQVRTGPSWHSHVLTMATEYAEGWTEYDQIQRAGRSIASIADHLGTTGVVNELWTTQTRWEYIDRSISTRRGHARHVINVFWMGYLILTHHAIRDWWEDTWGAIRGNRPNMASLSGTTSLEGWCAAWFYAGLFHDSANCVEKGSEAAREVSDLLRPFLESTGLALQISSIDKAPTGVKPPKWLSEFNEPLATRMGALWVKTVIGLRPDPGIAGAWFLRQKVADGVQGTLVREAGRAIALHNAFPRLGNEFSDFAISWKDDPLVALLVLCDQLQTWDRERGDDSVLGIDSYDRAELTAFEVFEGDPPVVRIGINYVAHPHVARFGILKKRVREALLDALRKHPSRALERLKDWPFDLEVLTSLNGEPLNYPMRFPRTR